MIKISFKDQIIGKRLILKRTRPTLKMAELIFNLIDKNRNHLEPWFPWPKFTLRVEDSLKYLFNKEEKIDKGEIIEYGLFIKDEYIGNISMFDISREDSSAEIAYWISSFKTGNGYVTEAIKLLEREAFETIGLNRIQIKCDERNKASLGVAKRCGYKYEGKFRENSFNEYFNDFANTLMFSKLKSEYIDSF